MTKKIFVNLPVTDLAATTALFTAIWARKNPQFSDGNASCMVWSDSIFFMLLTHAHYASFADRPIADTKATSAALLALELDSRDAVDALVAAAGQAGARIDLHPPQDYGFMYQRTFETQDGHAFSVNHMDMAKFPNA